MTVDNVIHIRSRQVVTAVSPTLPRTLAWFDEHPDSDADFWVIAAWFRAHAEAHGEIWNPEATTP